MIRCRVLLPAAAVLLLAPTLAHGGASSNARFLVHLGATTVKNGCNYIRNNLPGCHDIQTAGQVGTGYYAYVLLNNSASFWGVRFGITYDGPPGQGIDVLGWTSCGSFEFQSSGWPAAGTGNLVTWNDCVVPPLVDSTFPMAVVGFFYLSAYSPDEFELTPRPVDNQLVVEDCFTNEDVLYLLGTTNPLGWATFSADGTTYGSNPCGWYGGSCRIIGPATVDAGQSGIVYTIDPRDVRSTGILTSGGAGQIVSSDIYSATVTALNPGVFGISYLRSSGCVEGCGCGIGVTVAEPVPVTATTWSRLMTNR